LRGCFSGVDRQGVSNDRTAVAIKSPPAVAVDRGKSRTGDRVKNPPVRDRAHRLPPGPIVASEEIGSGLRRGPRRDRVVNTGEPLPPLLKDFAKPHRGSYEPVNDKCSGLVPCRLER
jgi:hypothetical protein